MQKVELIKQLLTVYENALAVISIMGNDNAKDWLQQHSLINGICHYMCNAPNERGDGLFYSSSQRLHAGIWIDKLCGSDTFHWCRTPSWYYVHGLHPGIGITKRIEILKRELEKEQGGRKNKLGTSYLGLGFEKHEVKAIKAHLKKKGWSAKRYLRFLVRKDLKTPVIFEEVKEGLTAKAWSKLNQ